MHYIMPYPAPGYPQGAFLHVHISPFPIPHSHVAIGTWGATLQAVPPPARYHAHSHVAIGTWGATGVETPHAGIPLVDIRGRGRAAKPRNRSKSSSTHNPSIGKQPI